MAEILSQNAVGQDRVPDRHGTRWDKGSRDTVSKGVVLSQSRLGQRGTSPKSVLSHVSKSLGLGQWDMRSWTSALMEAKGSPRKRSCMGMSARISRSE
jgi:hypothetical protein